MLVLCNVRHGVGMGGVPLFNNLLNLSWQLLIGQDQLLV